MRNKSNVRSNEYVSQSSRASSAGRSSDLSGSTTTGAAGWRLCYKDFWPRCTVAGASLSNLSFEPFSVLLPRGNAWLRSHPLYDVIKCETIERRICSIDQMQNDFLITDDFDDSATVFAVKGLRLWYMPRMTSDKPRSFAVQVGCRNVVPSRPDADQFPLVFDDLTTTYSCLNNQWLMDCPLEGPILTVETIAFDLVDVNVPFDCDRTCWPVKAQHHILYVTRIFYEYSCPTYEQIGAADFMPDLDLARSAYNLSTLADLSAARNACNASIMSKVDAWLLRIRDIHIVNVQTLSAALEPNDNVNSSSNFIHAADAMSCVQFVRITYARPKYGLPPAGLHTPHRLLHKTFTGSLAVLNMSSLWQQAHQWVVECGKRVVSVETYSNTDCVAMAPTTAGLRFATTLKIYVEETTISDQVTDTGSQVTGDRPQAMSTTDMSTRVDNGVVVVPKSPGNSKGCNVM